MNNLPSRKKLILIIVTFFIAITAIAAVIEQLMPVSRESAEKAGGQSYDNVEKKVLAKTPMIQALPVTTALFEINYALSTTRNNDPTAYAILVTITKEENKSYVLLWMTDRGYKPADYEIIYTINPDYENQYLQNLLPSGD